MIFAEGLFENANQRWPVQEGAQKPLFSQGGWPDLEELDAVICDCGQLALLAEWGCHGNPFPGLWPVLRFLAPVMSKFLFYKNFNVL